MRPFSRWRMARRRMYGSATLSMRMAVCSRVSHAEALEGVLQGQAVDDGGEHAHVVGGRLLDDLAAGGELGAAEDVAAADDDGQLHAAVVTIRWTCRAMPSVSSMLMPLCPPCPNASPLSLSRMRRYFGLFGSPVTHRGGSRREGVSCGL